ncbi:MAG TPA: YbaB/EbfC family nucleoid-associated protein [Beutenbergiaceae bacterium]|nr:YbaB/EbfC family nucleoid-associated protein [Beutenbergiaceae bacterium]
MTNVDLSEIRARIAKQLQEAEALSERAQSDVAQSASAVSEDGLVKVVVDGRGLLERVEFDPAMAHATADELRVSVLQALRSAHEELRSTWPQTGDPRAELNDTSILDALSSWLPKGNEQR